MKQTIISLALLCVFGPAMARFSASFRTTASSVAVKQQPANRSFSECPVTVRAAGRDQVLSALLFMITLTSSTLAVPASVPIHSDNREGENL